MAAVSKGVAMTNQSKHRTPMPQLNFEARSKHLDSTHGRLDQFIGGRYASQNLSALMFHDKTDAAPAIELAVWSAPGHTKPTFEEAVRQSYRKTHKGDSFGPSWTNHWFRVTIRVPKAWQAYERIQLEFDCSGEALIYTTDGVPLHGLTGGFEGDRRVEYVLPPPALNGSAFTLYIEASCNGMFGQSGIEAPDPNRYYKLNSADLCAPNLEAWALKYDFEALRGLFQHLPSDSVLSNKAMWVANEMMNVFREGDVQCLKDCRRVAEEVLGKGWQKEMEKKEGGKQAGTLWGVGHCHIDTAWLWPFSVTQQKVARSWSTQVDLMNRYPEHRFSCTQAQQFKWLEQLYPATFDAVKAKVSDGRFQPVGATWVEMDTNLPSGEALCRQFLYGQRYFESRFGERCKTFVLPDTFGYSSQLPQIARLAGTEYFFTQKLSWNSVNSFPHTTFMWCGLDGSQILTHMTPVNNYNSQCNMDDIHNGLVGHKNKDVTSQSLLLYGNGDGGGGPTPPMLEKLRRARAVGLTAEAGGQLPLVRMGGSMDEFFESVYEETHQGQRLPNWRGELYFELHRGTYTSHGSIKRGNRKSEILLREVEHFATMASLVDDAHYKYPRERLDSAWEDLLLCQFHDVLPGSGIAMIYADAEEKYELIAKAGIAMLEEAYNVIFRGSAPLSEAALGRNAGLLAINTVPNMPRREVIAVDISANPKLKTLAVQVMNNKTAYILAESDAGAVGSVRGLLSDAPPVRVTSHGNSHTLSNNTVSMTIKDGRIVSLRDNQLDRELIPHGQTGGLVIMEDHPNYWDAWDVEDFHLEKQTHLKFDSVSIASSGPLRATLSAEARHGQSVIRVKISLDAIAASVKLDARSMVRFDASVDWREKHKFLKFELPLDIHATDATYETQFGTVARPTHRNTSWDAAKFEVCGHKFADLSEYGYGVAILNDCKYGYATQGNVMRLSLLRAPTAPDADCDQGEHHFAFAVYPHKGTFAESDVPDVAYAFNNPMHLRHAGETPTLPSFSIKAGNVRIETIKRGEEDSYEPGAAKTIILRLYEHMGGHASAKLKVRGLKVAKAEIVNVLEDHVETIDLSHKLTFRGFEIKTIRLTLPEAKIKSDWVKL